MDSSVYGDTEESYITRLDVDAVQVMLKDSNLHIISSASASSMRGLVARTDFCL